MLSFAVLYYTKNRIFMKLDNIGDQIGFFISYFFLFLHITLCKLCLKIKTKRPQKILFNQQVSDCVFYVVMHF